MACACVTASPCPGDRLGKREWSLRRWLPRSLCEHSAHPQVGCLARILTLAIPLTELAAGRGKRPAPATKHHPGQERKREVRAGQRPRLRGGWWILQAQQRRCQRVIHQLWGHRDTVGLTHIVTNDWAPWCANHLKHGISVTDSVPRLVKVTRDESTTHISWANALDLAQHAPRRAAVGLRHLEADAEASLPTGMKDHSFGPKQGFRPCAEAAGPLCEGRGHGPAVPGQLRVL